MKWSAGFIFFNFIFFFLGGTVNAASTRPVNAIVKTSVCGNLVKETGEDCDNTDLNGKTCTNLGFASGNLTCDIGCGFDISGCHAPTVNPVNIAPDNLSSLLAAGYFTKPSSCSYLATSSLTATQELKIKIPVSGGTCQVTLPQNLVITRNDGADLDPTTITADSIDKDTLSGFTVGQTVQAGIQWGIAGTALNFDTPINLSIYVGDGLNGQSLNVLRSTETGSGWTADGIVAPATCLVSNGLCSFQATKASYYAVMETEGQSTPQPTATPAPTSTSTSSSSSTSSTSGSGTSAGSIAQTVTTAVNNILRRIGLSAPLQIYDIDGDGNISLDEMAAAVQNWANSFYGILQSQFDVNAASSPEISSEVKKCDINRDGSCNIVDFSILLYFVKK